jgi:hypothetical protein
MRGRFCPPTHRPVQPAVSERPSHIPLAAGLPWRARQWRLLA